jgi:peptidoglycan/xylan/chitin deacetylase (PgdA/CDA1 family)
MVAVLGLPSMEARPQQIAFTWDDLPAHSALPTGQSRVEIGRAIVAAMKAEHMPPVYGFVNGVRTEQEPASAPMLTEWRASGELVGNHTWSHGNLNQLSVEDFKTEVLKNEPLLKSLAGTTDWHWLRYPNLAEGNTEEKKLQARAFLAEHGYKIAGVTMSFGDYLWNEPYARCVAKKDDAAVAQLEGSYLEAADTTLTYTRAVSQALFGHDIPYVLLMHVGALDARMLPRLLALYKQRGVTFVSLEQAESDPFYKNDLDLTLSPHPDTLEEAMRMKGLPLPTKSKPSVDLSTICK